MKLLIQRVKQAHVSVDQQTVGSIDYGYVVFLGVTDTDHKELVDKMTTKLINLRICSDSQGKTNLSIKDINGSILIVSQFTLYADCKKGNRPSFTQAGNPQYANELYEYFIQQCKEHIECVEYGVFGADMDVSLVNDGPFTVMLDSDVIIR